MSRSTMPRNAMPRSTLSPSFVRFIHRCCGLSGLAVVVVVLALLAVSPADTEAAANADKRLDLGSSLAGSYLAGRHAQEERNLGLAADLMKVVLQSDPENPELMRRTFALFAAEGRFDEALPLARSLIVKEGPDPLISLFVAAEEIKKNRLADALGIIEGLSSEGLDAYTKPIFAAWIFEGMGQADTALQALKPLAETGGAKVLYLMHAGLISQHAGRMDAAERYFIEAMEDPNGSSIRLVEILAAYYEGIGKPEKAKVVIRDYLAGQTGSLGTVALERLSNLAHTNLKISSVADGIAEGLFGLGNSVRQQAGSETALFFGQIALYLRPEFDMVFIMLGETLEADERYLKAIDLYKKVDKKSSFFRSAQLRIADLLDQTGKTEDAIRALESMAKIYPKDPDPLIDLGDVLRGHDRFKESVEAYNQAFKRINQVGSEHWRLLYARGITLERVGNWDKAEQDLLKALDYQPNQPFVLNYLGYSWIEKGLNLDRALEMIRKAVSVRPTDGYIVDSLGWGLYRTGRFKEAVREMERAVELRPQDPIINDHLGDAYWQVGRKREARFQWHRSLSLDPESDLIRVIEQKLKTGLPPSTGYVDTNG